MIEFKRHPEIAYPAVTRPDGTKIPSDYDPAVHKAMYSYHYDFVFQDMASKRIPEIGAWKTLCLHDLFSMTHFIMGNPLMNTPFGVNACKFVQRNDTNAGFDVEIWARGHLKSFTMTQGQRIQRILKNPETCALILSYKKAAAERFLFSIMQTLENPFLTHIFPDILYPRPSSQSPSWSLQNGIVVKRQSVSRKEHTVDTAGLLEGMPTGGHWDDLDYDDVESLDTSRSPDITKSLIDAYEMSKNLGMPDGTTRRRVIGTFYSHTGLLSYLRDKVAYDGKPQHRLRIIPATHDGTRDGRPIFLSQSALDDLKSDPYSFFTQQLCDPTPASDLKLDFSLLKPIEPKDIPRDIVKFMVIDQAGGDETGKKSTDLWSYAVIGVEPCIDEIGQSNVYILDLEADKMSHSEGIECIVRMYMRNGVIDRVGVEKVGLSSTEIHISNALRARGRRVSMDAGNLKPLKPAGRSKALRIEVALQWPLNNGKLYYSTTINKRYLDTLEEEMKKFPFYHVDILDCIAYVYDLIKDYRFIDARDLYEKPDDYEIDRYSGRSAITGY